MIRTVYNIYLNTGYGYASDEMAAAADQTTDGVITIDSHGTVVPAERLGDQDLIPPLHEVRVQTVAEAQKYDELAARFRAALVASMRNDAAPALARRLEAVTEMDPERDSLAWKIYDLAGDRSGMRMEWMRQLPSVWAREIPYDDLAAEVADMEHLYPAEEATR